MDDKDNRKLYPLRFIDEGEDTTWGHVSYHVADRGVKDSMVSEGWFGGNTLSELMGTYMERVTGDDVFEFYGLQFPVTLKVMDVVSRQPLQVAVSDEVAAERYDSFGRTALWYIEEAAEGASIFIGLKKSVTASEFYSRCLDGTLEEVLNEVHPKKGDHFVIRPGTVYSAGPGLRIAEISECSELVLDIHDWTGGNPDMLSEAFDLIDFNEYSPVPAPGVLSEAAERLALFPEFTVTRLTLKNPLHIFSDQPGSFALYYCLTGEAVIQVKNDSGADVYKVKAGHSILVPSELNDYLIAPAMPGTVVLETLVERRMVRDSYTGEDVSPRAPLSDDGPQEAEGSDPHLKFWN